MNLSPEAIAFLESKGMGMADLAEFIRLSEKRKDTTAAERQQRCRANKRTGNRHAVTVTRDPLIEEIITPVSPPSSSDDGLPPSVSVEVVSAWNERAEARGLTKARPLDPRRQAKLRLRIKEQGKDGVIAAIRRIQASDFHCGLKPGSDWKADLPWLLKSPENLAKALDLPEPETLQHCAVDPLEAAERAANLMRRMGRDDDAAEHERRAAALRRGSTGPPRPIGQLLPRLATG